MKKLLIIGLALTTLVTTSIPVFAASNANLKTESTAVKLQKVSSNSIANSASYITNYYDAKVGLTQVLTGNYCEYGFTGAECATVTVQGDMILVTGTSAGTVVAYAYLNGVLRTVNYITFHY